MTKRIFTHTTWINRTPEAVFDYFIDFSKASSWRQYVRTMALVTPGPVQKGSKIHVEMDMSGHDYTFELEVLVVERPARWRHRTNEIDFSGYIEYAFQPENNGTRVTMSCVVEPKGLYGWLGLPLLMMNRGKGYAEQLPQLKRALE